METMFGTVDIKCVAVGKAGVGNRSTYFTLLLDRFPTDYIPCVHDNPQKTVFHESKQYRVGWWMTYGSPDYDRLRPLSYPGTHVFVLLFSVMDPESFQLAETRYLPETKQHTRPGAPYVLVGTKADLREDSAAVARLQESTSRGPITNQEGEMKVRELGLFAYHEISALRMQGITEMLELIVTAHLSSHSNQKGGNKGAKCVLM